MEAILKSEPPNDQPQNHLELFAKSVADNEALSQRKQAWVKIKIQEPLFNAKYRDVPDPDKCAATMTHA